MTELFARHGDIYRFHSPARRADMWVINHPDDVKRVLVSNHKNYTKGSGMDRVKILLGHGIMTSEGDLWKRQRYMMQPSFHRRVITEFSKLIDACNDRFIAKWEAQAARGELVNITDDMSELTLEIVLLSIFGTDLDRLGRSSAAIPSTSSPRKRRAISSSPTSFASSPSSWARSRSGAARKRPNTSISCRCSWTRATRKPARPCPSASSSTRP